jgi:hypothetical protein
VDPGSGDLIAGTPINGTVFSNPYDWRPFPQPGALAAFTAYTSPMDKRSQEILGIGLSEPNWNQMATSDIPNQNEIDDTANWKILSPSRFSVEKRQS